MYHFCLQEVNQPAQFSQEEGCLKRENCSRILWCIWTSRKRWASGLFRGARSECQYLSWHRCQTQEFLQEAKMKDVCTGGYWGIICQWKSGPYLTSVQASCQSEDLEKPRHGMFSVCDTFARTGSVNSSFGEPQVVCHLLSCCVHTSITSESESKVFEMSDKF